jgi:putative RecB family exonuclease
VADKFLRVDVEQPPNAKLPKRVSFSQMSLFQQCGLKYFFSYIDSWREPPTSALAGGSITHDVIERLYRLPNAERTLPIAMEILREYGPQFLQQPEYQKFAEDIKMKQSVREAIENLFAVEEPTELTVQPEHLEMELNVEINGVNFFGKVDRFTQNEVTRVTDYKTGKSPGKFVDSKLVQPYLYTLGYKTQFDIDVDEVELIFLNAKEVVRRPVDWGLVTKAGESLATMRSESELSISNSAWDAKVSKLCDYCAFQEVCPARNPDTKIPGGADCDTKLTAAGLLHK